MFWAKWQPASNQFSQWATAFRFLAPHPTTNSLQHQIQVWDRENHEQRPPHLNFLSPRHLPTPKSFTQRKTLNPKMADSIDYVRICESCPAGDGWGPSVTTETTLGGVPYAPFSKGDKLGRMADWTAEGKDRERGGRMQYNRNFRGAWFRWLLPCPAGDWKPLPPV